MRRIRSAVMAVVAALGAVAAGATPAAAGEVGPPYVIYGMGTPTSGVQIIARISGSKERIPLSERRGMHFLPNASLDGRVVAYVTITGRGTQQKWRTVIRRDGRVVARIPFTLGGGAFPTVSDDGSIVIFSGLAGLKAFDVEGRTWRPLCPACPPMSSLTSASISPDAQKIAVIRKIDGTVYVDIRRIADGRRLAIADTGLSTFATAPAWNAASDTVAYQFGYRLPTTKATSVVRTLTTSGVDSATRFADTTTTTGVHYFTSPKWINDAVWAIESTVTPTNVLISQVVTASDWQSMPTDVGWPLYEGTQLWRGELLFLVAWSAKAPVPAGR